MNDKLINVSHTDCSSQSHSCTLCMFQSFNIMGVQVIDMGLNIYLDVDYDGPLPDDSSATNRIYHDLSVLAGQTVDAANFICTVRPPREYCCDTIDFFIAYLNIPCLSDVLSDVQ